MQLILPSPVAMAAERAREATRRGRDIFLSGGLMGGWPLTAALKEHLRAGFRVYATPPAALTVHDDLRVVQGLGVVLTEDPPRDAEVIVCQDLDVERLSSALDLYGVPLPRRVAVAVHDHGQSIGVSNRDTRGRHWRGFIEGGGDLRELAYSNDVPPYFTRMLAVREHAPGALLMDTGPAAILGALLDPRVAERADEGVIVLNVGNGHTFGALIRGERMWGLFEEHTASLTADELAAYVVEFREGRLSHERVYARGGHGCFYHPDYRADGGFRFVALIGPNRRIADGAGYYQAAPYGDVMLAGCSGLLAASGVLTAPSL